MHLQTLNWQHFETFHQYFPQFSFLIQKNIMTFSTILDERTAIVQAAFS